MTPGERLLSAPVQPVRAADDFGLHVLSQPGGLRAEVLPNGALHALRHRDILINQLLPGPAEAGLFRLFLRWHGDQGPAGAAALVGPGLPFGATSSTITWTTSADDGDLDCVTSLRLHPAAPAWAWHVLVRNSGSTPRRLDFLLAQDLGLADAGTVRNNEAYVSQYLDLQAITDPALGPVVLARQNQPVSGGHHPWLAVACEQGAVAWCTDGTQFFGPDHRLTGRPAALGAPELPSRRLQYEFALAGLQSRMVDLAPGAATAITFVTRFLPHHPAASSAADLALVRELLPADWAAGVPAAVAPALPESVFTAASWLHGATPSGADLAEWFPGRHRHVDRDDAGGVLSFFCDADTHVACRGKEALVARPHGHILRGGEATWIDDRQFGLTCYAAGVFAAQAYLGNPSLARLLSVVRNHLNVARAAGQRVFLRHEGAWHQLGVPSAFALAPDSARWLYRLPGRLVEARVWCSAASPAAFLDLRVLAGPPAAFLVSHLLALGAHEFDAPGLLEVHEDGWLGCQLAPGSFTGRHLPGTCFALAATDASDLAAHGGDGLLYADGIGRHGPYAAFATREVRRCSFALVGATDGPGALPAAVAEARGEFLQGAPAARPPAPPVRLHGTSDPGVARLDEILPWFTHNAAIHFSAPHGLEQYGGAAWGVRDVTQGSLEWLLAAGDHATARRMLLAVFSQQYAHHPGDPAIAGCWPQWFMFPPFRAIQQTHSHGDVCLWPVKALCDYAEAADDAAFLGTPAGYTDPTTFAGTGPVEPLWQHCDRVVAHVESRFLPGTALVNYGDGDWDDTLQPADPSLRTRMVSAWTVALAAQTFAQLSALCRRAGENDRADRLDVLLARIRRDFAALLLPGGTVAGFVVREPDGRLRPLLHPDDRTTGIRHRLLPMTRAILAGLFSPDEAARHATLIESELRFPDGVRLMSEPAAYHGGPEKLFRRAETAANVGREIGLQYVHAHLRYAEAMARLGHADRLWWALQVVNPVGLAAVVPTAASRQANVYFSSSDADFADRHEAAARWSELRAGRVAVRAGWRLYSSGPGLFLHKVRSCLLGLRESFGDVVFDPMLPPALDGLRADVTLLGRSVQLLFRVRDGSSTPTGVIVNGTRLAGLPRDPNPYRPGGPRVPAASLASLLRPAGNLVELEP